MSTVTTADGTSIFYVDWGPKDAPPLDFHHGWPLSYMAWPPSPTWRAPSPAASPKR